MERASLNGPNKILISVLFGYCSDSIISGFYLILWLVLVKQILRMILHQYCSNVAGSSNKIKNWNLIME